MGFGIRLKQARQERGLSGPKLALSLGVQRSVIPGYESERISPSLAVLKKLASLLQVSIDWLVFGDEESRQELHDKELASYFQKVDRLDSRERAVVKMLLESILGREDLRAARRGRAGPSGESCRTLSPAR